MPDTVSLSVDETVAICEAAARRCGASEAAASSIAIAAVDAEAHCQPSVGLSHFLDYLDALKVGRIRGDAVPVVARPAPAVFLSNAQGGTAHLGFDYAFEALIDTAQTFGIALFTQRNAFTCGALGYFARRLAERGLVAFAATNGPALLAGAGGTKPVFCTNPIAFAAPVAGGQPLVIDQASSATAFVNIREAARRGETIPEGWAIDADGNPTTDPLRAMSGALLASGGARGANIALMVEVLAAGISGAHWSVEAPSFTDGDRSPGTGLTVIALAPSLFDPGFELRFAGYLRRLDQEFGVHVPGRRGAASRERAERDGLIVARALIETIAARGDSVRIEAGEHQAEQRV